MSEKEKKEVTCFVLRYILPDDWSEEEKEKNPISAEEVVEAIKCGKKVEIINAVIEGPFILKSVNAEDEITIQRTKIRGPIDLSYSTFRRVLNLENSIFETDAIFTAIILEQNFILNNSTFLGNATFYDIMVTGVFYSGSATFKKDAIFTYGDFRKRIAFNGSTFEGVANLAGARIGGNADFTDAQFKQKASFNSTQVDGDALFNPATFEGETDFTGAYIGGYAVFTKAQFKQKVSFNGTQVDWLAFFNPATFEGEADFKRTRIGHSFLFNEAKFKKEASFDGAHIEGDTYFPGTVFADNVSFQGTSFKAIFFEYNGKVMAPLKAKIDLRGCKYDRIDPISIWEQLMEYLEPYDRQPFTQLEETFRMSGEDGLVNDVYYERKRRESGQKKLQKNPGIWLMDRLHWLLTGYGVRLQYLIVWIILLLAIGTVIFHLNGAVIPNPNLKSPPEWDSQNALSYLEAFWVSFSTFLPVEIPSGADWIPSSQIYGLLGIKFTTFATLLKLTGWILVPVGIAGISGLLKR